jgi:hypothetical protein
MALNDWEMTFNGLTIGGYIDVTDYDLTSVEGLEGFDVRTNDEVLPSFWGSQPGGDFVNPRSMIIGVQAYPELTTEAAAFETAFQPPVQATPTTLQALVFKLPSQAERRVMCRVRRRFRTRQSGRPGDMGQWLVQLDAPDPRVYASALSTVNATPYLSDTSGIDYSVGSGVDLAFEYSVGSGTDLAVEYSGTVGGGSINAVNDGNTDTYPTFTFTTLSSMDQWTVINDTTLEQASFVFPLTTGHTLIANMAAVATGVLDPAVTTNGDPNYAAWLVPRVPIRLVPGANSLRFIVDSGTTDGQALSVTYRSAWI